MADIEYRIRERYVSGVADGNELRYFAELRQRNKFLCFSWWDEWRPLTFGDGHYFTDDIKKAEWRLICFELEYEVTHEVNPTLWLHHGGPGSNFDITDLPAEFDNPASAPMSQSEREMRAAAAPAQTPIRDLMDRPRCNCGVPEGSLHKPGCAALGLNDYPHVATPGRE